MKLYSSQQITDLAQKYTLEYNGECMQIEEGVLGHGKLLLMAPDRKTIVVTEVYLNQWSSAHKIRMYNKCPQKYKGIVNTF